MNNGSVLSRISPPMLIVSTLLFIALAPFLSRWFEFAGAGAVILASSILGRAGLRFWLRFAKIALPLVILSVLANWLINRSQGTTALWDAMAVGGRFAVAIFFSLLLVHVCTHQELVWGLGRLSDRLFKKPVIGEILALALLSVPFFMDSLSKVRKWNQIPKAVAKVFEKSRKITAHRIKITGKRPGWLLLASGVLMLAAAVVIR